MADPDIRTLRTLTRRLTRLASEQERVAGERRACVQRLIAAGWSLGAIADAAGTTKSAVQKMAR